MNYSACSGRLAERYVYVNTTGSEVGHTITRDGTTTYIVRVMDWAGVHVREPPPLLCLWFNKVGWWEPGPWYEQMVSGVGSIA